MERFGCISDHLAAHSRKVVKSREAEEGGRNKRGEQERTEERKNEKKRHLIKSIMTRLMKEKERREKA